MKYKKNSPNPHIRPKNYRVEQLDCDTLLTKVRIF